MKKKKIKVRNLSAESLRLPQFHKRVIPNKKKKVLAFNKRNGESQKTNLIFILAF